MSLTSFLERFVRSFAPEPCHQLARQTGWCRRAGKIDAFEFLISLIFGQLSASRQTLSSQAQTLGGPVTRQAVDQRFNARTAASAQAAFTRVMTQTLDWSPAHPQAVLAGKRSDQGQALAAAELLKPNELKITDKGFCDTKAWPAARERGAYLLMPLPHAVMLWEKSGPDQPEQLLDLAATLAASTAGRVAWTGLLAGKKNRRAGALRLGAFRLSPESAGACAKACASKAGPLRPKPSSPPAGSCS